MKLTDRNFDFHGIGKIVLPEREVKRRNDFSSEMIVFQLEVFTLFIQQTAEQITVFWVGEYP
jgi:hypothetical protein